MPAVKPETEHDPDEDRYMGHPIEECSICDRLAEASYDYWSGS